MVKDQPRLLELRQFDLVKLTHVDVLEQMFRVQFFCLFAFPGGAKDEDLMRLDKNPDGSYKFAMGEDNKPTWLPSAGWFCDQLDVRVHPLPASDPCSPPRPSRVHLLSARPRSRLSRARGRPTTASRGASSIAR